MTILIPYQQTTVLMNYGFEFILNAFGIFIQDFINCGSLDIHLLGEFCGAQAFAAQRQNALLFILGLRPNLTPFALASSRPLIVRSSIRSRSA